ncbi:hypothetical protein, partial [uncultured Stenotrophomonas sp.]|uniref:hypothetical protein n=1 Tax=uncultured Stenotrophomonas sp. TaxID=165438 RepID=UPI0025E08B63
GVPSKLGTYRKCRLQGRHFRSGYAGRPVDADLGRRRLEKPRTGTLSACRASSAPTENAACKGGIFVPATPEL